VSERRTPGHTVLTPILYLYILYLHILYTYTYSTYTYSTYTPYLTCTSVRVVKSTSQPVYWIVTYSETLHTLHHLPPYILYTLWHPSYATLSDTLHAIYNLSPYTFILQHTPPYSYLPQRSCCKFDFAPRCVAHDCCNNSALSLQQPLPVRGHRLYICIHICMCIHVCSSVYVCVYMCVLVYMCVYTCV